MKRLTVVLSILLLAAFCHAANGMQPLTQDVLIDSLEQQLYGDANTGTRQRPQAEARNIERDFYNGKMGERTNRAIDTLLKHAQEELSNRGYASLGHQIYSEWKSKYDGFPMLIEYNRGTFDIGDYPGIQFLIDVHSKIEGLLGEKICHATRLHDIFILAYTLPMAFKCSGLSQLSISADEYALHFNAFLGVVSYWCANLTCIVASGGIGVALCPLFGMVVEQIVVRYLSPKLAVKFYPKACKPQ